VRKRGILPRIVRSELKLRRSMRNAGEVSRRSLVLFVFLPAMLGLGLVYVQISRAPGSISAREAREMAMRDSSIVMLDVRTREEFAGESGHLSRALLLPVEELEGRIGELEGLKGRLLIAYCRSGRRSRNAATFLEGKGFRVLNLEGGILAWGKEGFPVDREARP
jgi:rhodanese-related sulfurtransferase